MIQKSTLYNCLFLDVETATSHVNFTNLQEKNPRLAKLWSRRAKYYRTQYEDMQGLEDSEIYLHKASLEPEFCRIVCVSFGVIMKDDSFVFTSFSGDDENDILVKTSKVLSNAHSKDMKLVGHNIKGFDIPCIGKRMLYVLGTEFILPPNLNIWNKKPWEIPFLDTSEMFAFGSWSQQKSLSLDLLTCAFSVESPKEEMDGSQVSAYFWSDEPKEKIQQYCERDVEAVMKILLKVSR